MAVKTHSLEQDFIVLDTVKSATIEPSDSTLYQRLDQNYNGFKGCELISCYEFSDDWPSWEKHPHGDEIVILLSGEATFVFQLDEGEAEITLNEPHSYVVVPKNVWHTAKTKTGSKLLFVTPGEGTQHKDL